MQSPFSRGAIGGLVVRPLILAGGSVLFMILPVVNIAAVFRVLLYVPMSTATVYQAKAWKDMLGFRMFKVGSGVIILLTTKIAQPFSLAQLSLVVMAICVSWTAAIVSIRSRYAELVHPRAGSGVSVTVTA